MNINVPLIWASYWTACSRPHESKILLLMHTSHLKHSLWTILASFLQARKRTVLLLFISVFVKHFIASLSAFDGVKLKAVILNLVRVLSRGLESWPHNRVHFPSWSLLPERCAFCSLLLAARSFPTSNPRCFCLNGFSLSERMWATCVQSSVSSERAFVMLSFSL